MKQISFKTAEFISKKIKKEKLTEVIVETGEKNKFIPEENKFVVTKELLSKKFGLFEFCKTLKKVDLSNLDFSEITSMICWFSICPELEEIIFPKKANCKKLTDLSNSFSGVELTSLDLSFMEIPEDTIVSIHNMFTGSHKLKKVVMPKLTTDHFEQVFQHCSNLEHIIAPITIKSKRKLPMHQCFMNNKSLQVVDFSEAELNFNLEEMIKIHAENIKEVPETCKFITK